MNIFIVDSDPRAAARQLCNRHTVKMPIETAQMLCTALQNHQYRSTKYVQLMSRILALNGLQRIVLTSFGWRNTAWNCAVNTLVAMDENTSAKP